jgi:hypothetical protein
MGGRGGGKGMLPGRIKSEIFVVEGGKISRGGSLPFFPQHICASFPLCEISPAQIHSATYSSKIFRKKRVCKTRFAKLYLVGRCSRARSRIHERAISLKFLRHNLWSSQT